jgi:hypothetical protein
MFLRWRWCSALADHNVVPSFQAASTAYDYTGNRVLTTSGMGFIGRNLACALREATMLCGQC